MFSYATILAQHTIAQIPPNIVSNVFLLVKHAALQHIALNVYQHSDWHLVLGLALLVLKDIILIIILQYAHNVLQDAPNAITTLIVLLALCQ